MTPAEIKALRQALSCTAKELGVALGLEQDTVLAWERGDLFPTKRFVDKMSALRAAGPSAIPKRRSRASATPMQALADPDLWRLFRKVLAHAELRAAVTKLAESYEDPASS